MGDKISIAEARARRSDPAWRRRQTVADVTGITMAALLVLGPALGQALSPRLGAAVILAVLVGSAAAVGWRGPAVGLERRSALLVAVPVLGLVVVLVPAVWRATHLHLQHWQGPLEPDWEDATWRVAVAAGVACWLTTTTLLVLLLV